MENSLQHYGVLGMKWGVRRARRAAGKAGKIKLPAGYDVDEQRKKYEAAKNKPIKDKAGTFTYGVSIKRGIRKSSGEDNGKKIFSFGERQKESVSKKKSVKDMSDDELQAVIDRIRLENRYKELISESNQRSKIKKGKAFVADIFEKSGKNIGTQLVTYVMGEAVNKMAKKDIVNPKKGQKDK